MCVCVFIGERERERERQSERQRGAGDAFHTVCNIKRIFFCPSIVLIFSMHNI